MNDFGCDLFVKFTFGRKKITFNKISRHIFQTDWTNKLVHFQKLLSNSFKYEREKIALLLTRTLNMLAENFSIQYLALHMK